MHEVAHPAARRSPPVIGALVERSTLRLIKTGVRALLAASLAAAFIFTAQPAVPA